MVPLLLLELTLGVT